MPTTIKVEITLNDEYLMDVMTNLVEMGGWEYWAYVDEVKYHYHKGSPMGVESFRVMDITDIEDCGGCANGDHCGSCRCCDEPGPKVVTAETVAPFIATVLAAPDTSTSIAGWLLEDAVTNDAGNQDATVNDVLMQWIVNGEVMYG